MAITAKQVKNIKFEDFDPNSFQNANEVWALYTEGRFRTFGSRASVLNAFTTNYKAKLYWMQSDGQWRLLATKTSHIPHRDCDWCDAPQIDPFNWGTAHKWCWERFGGKIPPGPDGVKLLCLCHTCQGING